MKIISIYTLENTKNPFNFLKIAKKGFIKHIYNKRAIGVLLILFSVFILSSCKTCKCPAYSLNNHILEQQKA